MSEATNTVGYYTGNMDVYYALMTTQDDAATAAVYGTPVRLAANVETTIKPRYKEGSLYASNRAVRRAKRIDGYDVTIDGDQISAANRAAVLGRTVDANKVHVIDGDEQSPPIAIGFGITKDNGKKELWWLYKGQLSELEVDAKTEGENIEYTTPKLEGVFDRRINDNRLAAVVDTDDAGVPASVAAGWFTEVYEYAATAASSGT